ncbi:Nitroreductase family protein [Actinopolyspora mzabensis]|uniref:Nitroreductase family protein n=1 Tax=Actinopolyspora mzabensis TaxID=995066 RepID=A0A1G9DR58_ACTMZ|nr:nitroreductase family protein [Actinopolyspora mzabensis]SDK66399.1 Nitroreductase family protein [Actinopolyspora mzabensis]
MSWLRPHRRRAGTSTTEQGWSPEEVRGLEDAVARAPSVHNTQPWELTASDRTALLRERPDVALEQHDPEGRDRRLSCGAAVTNLFLAVRELGWAALVRRGPEESESDDPLLVATVRATHRQQPSVAEGQRFRAITRRTSYRRPFHEQQLPHVAREALLAAGNSSDVHARWITGIEEARTLAEILGYAARVHRKDRHYQRELAMWLTSGQGGVDPGGGIASEDLGTEGVAAVGLVGSSSRLPDERQLAEWMANESIMVLTTATDEPAAHFRTGEAMQFAWLTATSLGLVASVITQPLNLTEVRAGLRDRLGLPGPPHALLRFGYPVPVPSQHRF